MKKIEAKRIFEFLSKIQVSKLDKETRSAVITDYLILNRLVKELESDITSLRELIFKGKDNEIQLYKDYMTRYRNSGSESEKSAILSLIKKDCSTILVLEDDMIEKRTELENEEIAFEFRKFNRDTFFDSLSDAGFEYTMEDVLILEPLFLD